MSNDRANANRSAPLRHHSEQQRNKLSRLVSRGTAGAATRIQQQSSRASASERLAAVGDLAYKAAYQI